MTYAEWELDIHHAYVEFLSLQRVFPIESHSYDVTTGSHGGQCFAIAATGHFDEGRYDLLFGIELFRDRSTPNPVNGFYRGRQSFHVAGSFEEFVSIATTRTLYDPILDPERARYMEAASVRAAEIHARYVEAQLRATEASAQLRWWQFWKR